jgi:nitrous oxide reductase
MTKPAIMNTSVANKRAGNVNPNAPLKEFTVTSFVEFADGKPKPQFSLKEITVNKGDFVRIKITNTKGTHDFKIDELNVFADTPSDQEVLVEFTADKAGEFVYYCTKPGHRTNGQWGTLKVLE